jgi:hypothetical protein
VVANFGLVVPLVSKPDQVKPTTEFLLKGRELIQREPETLQWFAIQYGSSSNLFALFDMFAAQSGQFAHLTGDLAESLKANSGELLGTASEILQYQVLASTVKSGADVEGVLKKGLIVRLIPKAGQETALKEFLLVSRLQVMEYEGNINLFG